MRPVRPTIQVLLSMIDNNLFNSENPQQLIEQNMRTEAVTPFEGLDFTAFDVTLLNMARQAFAGDKIAATKHSEFSAVAKRPVYEIRNKQTGWRGIVILDQYGDPWMVYCGSHGDFHSGNCKSIIKASNASNYMPSEEDYLVRKREEERQHFLDFERRVVQEMLNKIRAGIYAGQTTSQSEALSALDIPYQISGAPVKASIQIQQDDDDDSATVNQFVELTLDFPVEEQDNSSPYARLHRILLRCFNAICQPKDPNQPTETSLKTYSDGQQRRATMSAFVLLEPDDIKRITSPNFLDDSESLYKTIGDTEPESMLHRVPKETLTDAYVEGTLIRSLCGKWFVPTRDEYSGLPACPDCQDILEVKEYLRRNYTPEQ